jgi:rubrerythrin
MKKFIASSIEIETVAALIYYEFAKSKVSNEELAVIWKDMAKDEEDHANALRLAARVPSEETFQGIQEDCPNPESIMELLNTLLARAKKGHEAELSMLKDAVILENKFRKFHATYALIFKDPGMQKTFSALARADDKHLEALKLYIKEFKLRQVG